MQIDGPHGKHYTFLLSSRSHCHHSHLAQSNVTNTQVLITHNTEQRGGHTTTLSMKTVTFPQSPLTLHFYYNCTVEAVSHQQFHSHNYCCLNTWPDTIKSVVGLFVQKCYQTDHTKDSLKKSRLSGFTVSFKPVFTERCRLDKSSLLTYKATACF